MGIPVLQRQPDGSTATVDLSEADAESAFRSGQAQLPVGVPVRIRLSDGQIREVAPENASTLLSDYGGSFATPGEVQEALNIAEYESTGGQVRAAIEGGARGLTMGGYDVAARALGADTEAMRQRRERNPWVSGVSEAVGAIAPMFIPGAGELNAARIAGEGVEAATTLGRVGEAAMTAGRALGAPTRAVGAAGDLAATGARLAGEVLGLSGETRLARMAVAGLEGTARGAAEGALMGAGQTVSEAALSKNPDLVAEHLLANIGTGALFGGLAGGALGVGARALREGGEVALAGSMRAAEAAGVTREGIQAAKLSARLEASGVTDAESIIALGGPEQLAADLDRLKIGQSGGAIGLPTVRGSLKDAVRISQASDTRIAEIESRLTTATAGADRQALAIERSQVMRDKLIADKVQELIKKAPPDTLMATAASAAKEGISQSLNLGALGHLAGSPGGFLLGLGTGVAKEVLKREAGRFVPALQNKGLEFLLRATEEGSTNSLQAAAGLIGKRVGAATRSAVIRGATAAEYTRSVESIRADTPERIVRQVAAALPEVAHASPEVMASATNRALTARAYLESKIPSTDRNLPSDLQPQLRKSSPVSEADKAQFLAIKNYVENPREIIKEIQDQRLTIEAGEVLREVYPELRKEIVGHVMSELAKSQTEMSYQSRLRLGILLGAPTDPSLEPSFISAMQSQFNGSAPAQESQPRNINQAAATAYRRNISLAATGPDSRDSRSLRQ